ncbi:MAG: hypothetical protein RLZZ450_7075, partial [Pseudomonadota bacterium]
IAARTPVGATAEGTAAAIRAGISRVAAHDFMVDPVGDELYCACDPELAPTLFGVGRIIQLVSFALEEMIEKLAASQLLVPAISVLLALPELRPGFGDLQRLQLRHALEALDLGVALQFEFFCEGHAGALHALKVAMQRLRTKTPGAIIITGGVDSYLEADTIDWLDAEQLLARSGRRSGMPPGEGAVLLALTSDASRRAHKLPLLATCLGSGLSVEARKRVSAEGLLGEGLSRAVLAALESATVPTDVYCDINGERWRVDDWGFAVLRCSERLGHGTNYTTGTSSVGDLGAASGALGCMLAAQAGQRGYARGRYALVCGSSWSGQRAAILLEPRGR